MNLGILEGLQGRGASDDATLMEMLPGNHKDGLPLIYFVPTLPHDFCCPVSIDFIFLYLSVSSLSVLNFLPPRGSFSNRLRQVHCSLFLTRNLLFPEPSTEVTRGPLYVALNSTRINCMADFSKGACHVGAMGMNVPCP